MQYTIVTVEEEYRVFEKLEKEVNKLIREGWKPLGGISVMKPYESLYKICASQAMIKE